MRHTPAFALLLPLLAVLMTTKTQGQIYFPPVLYPPFSRPFGYPRPYDPPPDPKNSPVEVGVYATVGDAVDLTPPPRTSGVAGAAGIYGQWNRYGLCPGLDLRIQGNANNLHGYLVGPRVAFQSKGSLRSFRLYAEGLVWKE